MDLVMCVCVCVCVCALTTHLQVGGCPFRPSATPVPPFGKPRVVAARKHTRDALGERAVRYAKLREPLASRVKSHSKSLNLPGCVCVCVCVCVESVGSILSID